MSEEKPEQTPPKLKLSRKLREPEKEEPSEPKPNLQLRRPAPESTPEPTPEPTSGPETPPPLPPLDDSKPVAEAAEEPDYDPENPFGGIVAEEKTEKLDRPPPELPSKPPPAVDDGSIRKIEEALGQIEEPKKNNQVLVSVIVIVLLLGLLGGAGYGLYYIFRSAPTESADPAIAKGEPPASPPEVTVNEEKESGGFLSNSIEAAKAAIAKIPSVNEEEVLAEPETESANSEAASNARAALSEIIPLEDEPPATPEKPTLDGNAAASFLTTAHIGGVRTGSRPKVILNGESYVPGDLVDPALGLKFIGFRDDKLAFKDEKGIVYVKSF